MEKQGDVYKREFLEDSSNDFGMADAVELLASIVRQVTEPQAKAVNSEAERTPGASNLNPFFVFPPSTITDKENTRVHAEESENTRQVDSVRKSSRISNANSKLRKSPTEILKLKTPPVRQSSRPKRVIKPRKIYDSEEEDEESESPVRSPRKRSNYSQKAKTDDVEDTKFVYDSNAENDDENQEAEDSPGEIDGVRKCITCLRQCKHTDDIFDKSKKVMYFIKVLTSHLEINQVRGNNKTVGLCNDCMHNLQKWHLFRKAICDRQEEARNLGVKIINQPVEYEVEESKIYRNYGKMGKVKEVFLSATHSHLVRRHLTDKDWDFFCDHLFKSNSVKSLKSKELEDYLMSPAKLSHIFCTVCGHLVSNGKTGFREHMLSDHAGARLLFPCDICGESFPEKDMTAASEDYYPHWISHFYFSSCDDCGKRFPTRRALGQHRHAVHKNRQVKCEQCGKVLANKMSYDLHRLRHLPETEKKAFMNKCKVCKKKVAQWNLKMHMLTHSDERPWKCDMCDSSFKMKGALVSHRDVVHFNLKNHVCSICSEAFKSASSLRGHVRRHQGRKDYKCEVCLKEYFTYSALKGHSAVHATARNFVCETCGKSFKNKKALKEHVTLHTGLKLHRCPICAREVRVKSNLYKHMKIHKKSPDPNPPAKVRLPNARTANSKGTSKESSDEALLVPNIQNNHTTNSNELMVVSSSNKNIVLVDAPGPSRTVAIQEGAGLLSMGLEGMTQPSNAIVAVQEIPVETMRFYQQHFGNQEIQIMQTIQPQDFVTTIPGSSSTTYFTSNGEYYTV